MNFNFSEGPGTEKKGSFMRKGETGDWRSKLSEEQVSIYRSGLVRGDNDECWGGVSQCIVSDCVILLGNPLGALCQAIWGVARVNESEDDFNGISDASSRFRR